MIKTTLAAAVLVAAGFAGAASAATVTDDFQVRITITDSCTFGTNSVTDVNFGDKARGSAGDVTQTGTLVVNCTTGTPYNIGLNGGQHGTGVNDRKMKFGSNVIPYALYRDGALTQNWGNTVGTDTVPGVGDGLDQNITVYGRVLGGTNVNVPAGTYTDTITATITY